MSVAARRGPRRSSGRAFADGAILYRGTPPEEEARIAEVVARQTRRLVKPLVLLAGTVGRLPAWSSSE